MWIPDTLRLMKIRKYVSFAGFGAAGAAAGALIGEVLGADFASETIFGLILATAWWSAICAAPMALGLFWAGERYNRRRLNTVAMTRVLIAGLVAGAIGGAVAQAVYMVHSEPNIFKHVVLRSICWGLMGAIVGARVQTAVPNMGRNRGMLAGAVGGIAGGLAFVAVHEMPVPPASARVIGLAMIGAALGSAIVAVDWVFREAGLEVRWGPKETTMMSLGREPISIGGGDDHVRVAGLPEHAATISYAGGVIDYQEPATGKRLALRNGSRVKVGNVEVVVHART